MYDLHRGLGAQQGVLRGLDPVEGLDQEGRAHAVRGAGGVREVLQGQGVLFGGVDALDPVAVRRVEGGAAQGTGEVGGDVDVGAEAVGLGAGEGEGAPVGAGEAAGVEVEAGEADAGVGDRPAQGVEFGGVGRRGVGPRPPQLDVAETVCGDGRRAFEEGEVGEEDRDVDGVPPVGEAHRHLQGRTEVFRMPEEGFWHMEYGSGGFRAASATPCGRPPPSGTVDA